MNLDSFFPKSDSAVAGNDINTQPGEYTGKITDIKPYKDKNGNGYGQTGSNGKKIRAFAVIRLHGAKGSFSHILNWNDDNQESQDGSLGVLVSMVKSMRKSCGLDTDGDVKTRQWCIDQLQQLKADGRELKFEQYSQDYTRDDGVKGSSTKLRFHE